MIRHAALIARSFLPSREKIAEGRRWNKASIDSSVLKRERSSDEKFSSRMPERSAHAEFNTLLFPNPETPPATPPFGFDRRPEISLKTPLFPKRVRRSLIAAEPQNF
ncbi:hypothetical protein E2N92_12465 [Methanofollis formosanus]|uniref:Uncharacterized protein n=1 Tax=Methanofollis formosanus TaxID=299308 RepID=A0A8G1A410_9EURY|nr:hypothetical protein [Methanofollis formosanus]QYZ80185.1 hypothetical protein E2N92_12465 [Methanofollis formosanus]